MILGVDAHCIRGDGGSVTHLREVFRVADPAAAGFAKVVLWSGQATLERIEDRPWLEKVWDRALDRDLLRRTLWSSSTVAGLARNAACDVLWVPGCSYAGSFRPYVAMSRNMLPFDWREMRRYAPSSLFLKFLMLRFSQSLTYRHSAGMIYLTRYAMEKVGSVVGRTAGDARVIPHGIESRFTPAAHAPADEGEDGSQPYRLLYVSAIDLYKHQWNVIAAVEQLQRSGTSIELTLIGPVFPAAASKFKQALQHFRGTAGSVRHLGLVRHSDLHRHYQESDIFVYASSCENLPNILLEAMASGKPIACSSHGPMPEVLKDGGVYFDPENSTDIAAAIDALVRSPSLRADKAARSLRYSREYSWERCASESFAYLADVARRHRGT